MTVRNPDKPTQQDVDEAVAVANSMIGNGVANGTILECNVPKICIMFDKLRRAFVCAPNNVLTMYMSLTFGYNLSNTEHYDRFTHLSETESMFVQDLNDRYRREKAKYELRSMATFPGIEYYKKVFGFPKYNPRHFHSIADTLTHEYKIGGDRTFDEYQKSVYSVITRIDQLYGMSGGSFEADKMWQYLFDKMIRMAGISRWMDKCDNDRFRSLYNIYSPDNIEARKTSQYTYDKKTYKKPPPMRESDERKDYLLFMGLTLNYNSKTLKKRFRKLAVKYHPDKSGGDNEKFLHLKKCYEELQKYL